MDTTTMSTSSTGNNTRNNLQSNNHTTRPRSSNTREGNRYLPLHRYEKNPPRRRTSRKSRLNRPLESLRQTRRQKRFTGISTRVINRKSLRPLRSKHNNELQAMWEGPNGATVRLETNSPCQVRTDKYRASGELRSDRPIMMLRRASIRRSMNRHMPMILTQTPVASLASTVRTHTRHITTTKIWIITRWLIKSDWRGTRRAGCRPFRPWTIRP